MVITQSTKNQQHSHNSLPPKFSRRGSIALRHGLNTTNLLSKVRPRKRRSSKHDQEPSKLTALVTCCKRKARKSSFSPLYTFPSTGPSRQRAIKELYVTCMILWYRMWPGISIHTPKGRREEGGIKPSTYLRIVRSESDYVSSPTTMATAVR